MQLSDRAGDIGSESIGRNNSKEIIVIYRKSVAVKVLNSYELQDKGSVMKTIVRTKKEKVTWKEFFQVVMAIAFPIAIQNLLGTTASMVDTIMIGSQGELAVAAVGICSQISSLYFNCYWGFASGSVLFFSQYWGARDEEGINRTLGISLLFMSIVAVLFRPSAFSFRNLCLESIRISRILLY